MSGIVGIYDMEKGNVAEDFFFALNALQHRGEEGCGVHVEGKNGKRYTDRRRKQSANYAFGHTFPLMQMAEPYMAIGHTLYESSGDVQPGTSRLADRSLTLAMDGNLLGVDGYADRVIRDRLLHYLIEHNDDVSVASNVLMDEFRGRGSFNIVAVYKTPEIIRLIALRGRKGIKPMVYAEERNKLVIASESKVLAAIGMKSQDFEPGTVFDTAGTGSVASYHYRPINREPHMHCGFEWIYFADPTSIIEGFDVLEYRMGVGRKLAERCPYGVDFVCASPDSGRGVSMGFAQGLGAPYMDAAIIKNPGAKRTFQVEDPEERRMATWIKFHMNARVMKDKIIAIGDDSIVRGTVFRDGMLKKMRSLGAEKLYPVISCAPLRYPCYRDPTTTNFAAQGIEGSVEDVGKAVAKKIGADDVLYPTIKEMREFLPDDVCLACMDGKYPVDDKWLGKD